MSEEAPTDVQEPVPVSEKPVNVLFRYSQYVHVGHEAASCEHAEDGQCENAAHFHAWITLPNQFQQESLQQKARAARARLQRALRDPESDAYLILDGDLVELRETASEADLISFLVGVKEQEDRLEAMGDLESTEEWENRTEDVLRLRELEAMAEEDRPQEEIDQLVREGERYLEAVLAKMEEIQAPRKNALGGLTKDQLLQQWREHRVTLETGSAFGVAYSQHEWLTCTFKTDANDRPKKFSSRDDLAAQAPEVLEALQIAFHGLELNMQRQLSGNW